MRLCADVAKARKILGFEPRISLRDGLGHLRDWYKSHERSIRDLLSEELVHNWKTKGT